MLKKKLKDIEKGDTFAYEIVNDEEYKGRYLILWETGMNEEGCEKYHFMRIKITNDNKLPESEEEFQKLEDVICTITPMEGRFFPLSGLDSIEKQIEERSKIPVEPDDHDYLYSYTLRIGSFRIIYKNLVYLGNYEINNDMHPKEFLPFSLINLNSAYGSGLEEKSLLIYKGYNLKQFKIWNDQEQREIIRKQNEIFLNAGKNIKQ